MSLLYKLLRRGVVALTMLVICTCTLYAKEYTVVIDAGHGGKDVGAVDNQVYEKDINLAVALELGRLIKKNIDDVKVVYTRDKDVYLTLQQRAEKANKAKGDLFISIHTNSVAKSNKNRRTICGASTYTLGLHKDEDNKEVARRENAVMTLEKDFQTTYQGFNPNSDESYIIFELSQKTNMSQSIKLANDIQKQLAKVANRQDRGVHQAGFWVLWATSMPAVLVELDFICNPISAKYLSSDKGQEQLAKGIFNAVDNYFNSIRAHNKKPIQVNNDEEQSSDEKDSDFSAQVLISSATTDSESKRGKAPEKQKKTCQTTSGQRRRRSMESKQASEQQKYEVAVIQERKQPYYQMVEGEEIILEEKEQESLLAQAENTTQADEPANQSEDEPTDKKEVEKAVVKKNKKTAIRNDKNSVNRVKTEKIVADNSNTDNNVVIATSKIKVKTEISNKNTKQNSKGKSTNKKRTSKAKLNKKKEIYKIHLLTCDELLRAGDERFCGLKPIKCKLCDGKYLYTYGESESQKEMEALLKTVKAKIPMAYVMKDFKTVK